MAAVPAINIQESKQVAKSSEALLWPSATHLRPRCLVFESQGCHKGHT